MSESINDRIMAAMNKPNLSEEELEAELAEINQAILNVWADTRSHVKTVASLPQEVFDEMVANLGNIRACINEGVDDAEIDYSKELPQDVVLGHLIVEGINSMFEKHAKRRAAQKFKKMIEEKLDETGLADLVGAAALAHMKKGGKLGACEDPEEVLKMFS